MTPDDLEARLASRPDSATVAAVLTALRADSDWSMTEFTLADETIGASMLHRPTGTAYTLSRRWDQVLRRTEGR